MDLRGKSALVTGGSRGLGAALGETLAKRGAHVVLVAREEKALAKIVEKIRAACAAGAPCEGGEAHGIAFDVGDKESAHRITGAAAALVGPIDVLVQN
ncbi:MAG TPA: SDR family NAD(P)-dependent oxidoreductase, partial [Polyangiaceae bacterium]|nr:SDR family NAD(P)-dependent oxidoreductase [Polyangiaceae bacterium]